MPVKRSSGQSGGWFGLIHWRWSLLAVALMMAAPKSATAAPPLNDSCSGAFLIPGIGPFPYYCPVTELGGATTDPVESFLTNSLCSVPVSRGVWWKFRPITNSVYTVTTCAPGTTTDDTVMAIYSAASCGSNVTTVACNDDANGACRLLSVITVPLLADTDYYIVVWLYGTAVPATNKTSVQIIVTKEVPPPNDTCQTALPVFLNTPISGSTVLASNNYRLSSNVVFVGVGQRAATGMGRDVVYSFTAPETGDYSFKVSAYKDDADFDLMVFIGAYCAPGPGPQLLTNVLAAANRNHVGTSEEVLCVPLTNRQLVYIYVDDTNFNNGSSFVLEVTRFVGETEPNDSPATASRLVSGVEGSISPAGDYDYFALGAFPAGWRVFAMAVGDAANTPPDFQMRVTTLVGTIEYDDNDNDPLFGQTSPNIAGALLPGGPAFLSMSGSSALEPYRLYAVVQPPTNAAAIEVEPNNTVATANSSPANYFYGRLAGPSPSKDEDMYRFTAMDGDLVFVSLDGDPTRDGSAVNAKLELLDEYGNSLVLVNDGRSSSSTARTTNTLTAVFPDFVGEALVYRCQEGIYHVRVSIGTTSTGNSGSGDYLLSISKNGITGASGVNNAPILTGAGVSSPVFEGSLAILSGAVFDPDIGDSLLVQVDWGDGSTDALNFTKPGLTDLRVFQHRYLDDVPTGTAADSFPITITAIDSFGESAAAGLTVLVSNAPPKLLDVAVTSPVYLNSNAVLTATLLDPGILDTFSLTLDWGDGSPVQRSTLPAGTTSFTRTHLYVVGDTNFTIRLNLLDDDLGADAAIIAVVVRPYSVSGSFVGLTRSANGQVVLRLHATPLTTYRILGSADLLVWSEIGSAVSDGGGMLTFEDDSAPAWPVRFYRAVTGP